MCTAGPEHLATAIPFVVTIFPRVMRSVRPSHLAIAATEIIHIVAVVNAAVGGAISALTVTHHIAVLALVTFSVFADILSVSVDAIVLVFTLVDSSIGPGMPSESMHLSFEEIAFVQRLTDDFVHVVRLVGIVGDQRVEARLLAVPSIRRRTFGHIFAVRQRQIIEEIARREQRVQVREHAALREAEQRD